MTLLLSIPIGIMYNLIISKSGHLLTENSVYKDKIQNNLIIEILGGVVAFAIAFLIFGNKKYENKTAKYGLIFGGIILLFSSIICNWDIIEDATKLFSMIGVMCLMILYSYKKNN